MYTYITRRNIKHEIMQLFIKGFIIFLFSDRVINFAVFIKTCSFTHDFQL